MAISVDSDSDKNSSVSLVVIFRIVQLYIHFISFHLFHKSIDLKEKKKMSIILDSRPAFRLTKQFSINWKLKTLEINS